jgi:glycosyltransferase involved in cell wall biosynthesis
MVMAQQILPTDQIQTVPLVTIMVPVRNEESFIEDCLTSLLSGSYPADRLEMLVLDGCSTDSTVTVVEQLAARSGRNIRVLNNPGKTQPYALNIGIQQATGEFIARADAHSKYPPHYIAALMQYMRQYPEAENIGGLWDVQASQPTATAEAIAVAYTHRFSTGNALYRVGVDTPTFTDTVPFGFYRRHVFERYGMYDVELPRNEDQEFNHRIIARGGKVLLVPDVKTTYYARPTFSLLGKMFFQYGWFKPLSQRKQQGIITYRHFIPLLALVLFFGVALSAFISGALVLLSFNLALCGMYFILSLVSATNAIAKKHVSYQLIPLVCLAFWVSHVCFTAGNLKGIWDFLILRKRVNDIALSR